MKWNYKMFNDSKIFYSSVIMDNSGDTICRTLRDDAPNNAIQEERAKLICDSVNGTAGIGINPNSVKEMKEALEGLNKVLDNYWNYGRSDEYVRDITKWQQKSLQALKNSTL